MGSVPSDQPSIFISYSHQDAALARALAKGLEGAGHRVWIDEGELRTGDSIIERIATAIAEVDFLVALVTEASVQSRWCQKELALAITGELGREGIRVLPLRVGEVEIPPSLKDQKYLAVDPQAIEEAVATLTKDVGSYRAESDSPQTSAGPTKRTSGKRATTSGRLNEPLTDEEPIMITGIVEEGVGHPDRHPARGSALYRVPLRLSRRPPQQWAGYFERTWDHPPRYTTLHRPGICRVIGDTVVLDGTTIEELENTHLVTLRLVLDQTNQAVGEAERKQRLLKDRERLEREQHEAKVREAARRLRFD